MVGEPCNLKIGWFFALAFDLDLDLDLDLDFLAPSRGRVEVLRSG
jgi:hypothetical protein